MQILITPMISLFLLIASFYSAQDFEPISSEYLSPEYMHFDQKTNKIYVGLSTFEGVAVYDVSLEKIKQMIPMPSPVKGVLVADSKLYATAGKHNACIYVYDLTSQKLQKTISTGHGPTDMAISKKSKQLFIANRFSNDISVIDIEKQKEIKRIKVDREPVALALSPDERLLTVANLLPSQASTEPYISSKITLIDSDELNVLKQIELPNGSYSLKDVIYSSDGIFIYITHLLGRYNVLTNQIEKGWINTNALSIIDTKSREYYTTVLLDDIHKGAANPNGLGISDDEKNLFVTISGTNELYMVDLAGMHSQIEKTKNYQKLSQSTNTVLLSSDKIKRFESPIDYQPMGVRFEDIPRELSFLAPVRKRIQLKGRGPMHVISHAGKVYITNYFSDGLEVFDLNKEKTYTNVKIGNKDVLKSQERYGELLFHSAEKCFQQWQSCASCHPGEGRVDGLNWDLMNDGIGNPKNTKSLLFSHQTPPVMATGIRADAETGVRAGFKFIQFFDVSEEDAQAVDAYLKSLKPVDSPFLVNGKLSKSSKQGKQVFDNMGCANCHSGTYFTDLQQHDMGERGEYDKQNIWDTPTLIELWRTGPYMHDGRYDDLHDVFKRGKHGLKESLSVEEVVLLTDYLLSL